MDDIKAALHCTIDAIASDFLAAWDVNLIMAKTVARCAPVLRSILLTSRCSTDLES